MESTVFIDKLCSLDSPYRSSAQRDELFVDALRENYRTQLAHQPFIRFLAERAGFAPEDLKSIEDIEKIPPLFVGVMKIHTFCNVPDEEIAMVLTSSGTKGQKTQAFFDKASLERLESLAYRCFSDSGWTSDEPAHVFIMGYDIREEKNLGTSWSNNQLLSLVPAKSVNWTILKNADGEFEFDYRNWAKRVIELAEDAPIRLTGFPAFMSQLAKEIATICPGFRAKPGSFITAGGGWKNHKGVPLKHLEFAAQMEASMGIPAANIRDAFGMAEHGIPYCSCSAGHYHIPVYSRLLVRDPLTMKVLPDGEEGLMNLITPYNTAEPNLSVLATDLAVVREGCPCGIPGKYIDSVRRGGISKNRGCAIAAQELLDRSQGGNK